MLYSAGMHVQINSLPYFIAPYVDCQSVCVLYWLLNYNMTLRLCPFFNQVMFNSFFQSNAGARLHTANTWAKMCVFQWTVCLLWIVWSFENKVNCEQWGYCLIISCPNSSIPSQVSDLRVTVLIGKGCGVRYMGVIQTNQAKPTKPFFQSSLSLAS